jgi:dTDP-glucose 4,6-dehydratase
LNGAGEITSLQKFLNEEDAAASLCSLNCWSYFENKRVVVTGAGGMLGGWVTLLLARMKVLTGFGPELIQILTSGVNTSPPIWDGLVPRSRVSSWAIAGSLQDIPEADLYLHLASPASARDFLSNPLATLDLNTYGTARLLESAGLVPGSRVLFVSSSEIYGLATGLLTESTHGIVPVDRGRWIYAESKRLGEILCQIYGNEGRTSAVIVRPFHTFGPGMKSSDSRIFGDFISGVLLGQRLTVRGDPTTTRTFCYAPEAAAAFLLAAARGCNGEVFNVAGQVPETIGGLAESLTREFLPAGATVKYSKADEAATVTNPATATVADTSRIQALGWTAATDALTAFRKTIKYLRAGDN